VPYYLVFHPDEQDLQVYRHDGDRYNKVKPSADGRFAIKELDLECGLLEGWVRYWYQGQLLPLPAEMQRATEESQRQAADAIRQAAEASRRAEELQRQLDAAQKELAK